jgi:hypothetical protein
MLMMIANEENGVEEWHVIGESCCLRQGLESTKAGVNNKSFRWQQDIERVIHNN